MENKCCKCSCDNGLKFSDEQKQFILFLVRDLNEAHAVTLRKMDESHKLLIKIAGAFLNEEYTEGLYNLGSLNMDLECYLENIDVEFDKSDEDESEDE